MSIITFLGVWLALSVATFTLWAFAGYRLKQAKEARERQARAGETR